MIKNAQQIKDSADIYATISQYVPLKRAAANYKGCCPFHNEKSASFTVSPAKNLWKCFGCGATGVGAVSFVMKHESCDYPTALETTAKINGIAVEYEENAKYAEERLNRENLFNINKAAMNYFAGLMTGNNKGFEYLNGRGFSPEFIKEWTLGYAPDGWQNFSSIVPASQTETAIAAGLLSKSENGRIYDKVRNAIFIPFLDLSGNVIGYTRRDMSGAKDTAKYMNSPENEIFSKSNFLFGLYQAKKAIQNADEAYIVEGQLDCMMMHQKGFENTVAPGGTALTEGQLLLLKRFTGNIILFTDGDSAGQRAAWKDIDLCLKNNFSVEVCTLPEGEDPAGMFRDLEQTQINEYLLEHTMTWFVYKCAKAETLKNEPEKFSEIISDIEKSLNLCEEKTAHEYAKKLENIFSLKEIKLKKAEKTSGIFALDLASESIKKHEFALLIENSEKVIDYHLSGIDNTISFNGIIGKSDIKKLRQYTNNIKIKTLFEMPMSKESDFILCLKKLIVFGFQISIFEEEEEIINKETGEVFEGVSVSFIDWYIRYSTRRFLGANDKTIAEIIENCAELISHLPETERLTKSGLIIDSFKKANLKITASDFKKILQRYVKKNAKDTAETQPASSGEDNDLNLSESQINDLSHFQHYYKSNAIYVVANSGVHTRISNFVIKPIIHSNTSSGHFKLFEMRNQFGLTVSISLDTKDLNDVKRFKCAVEGKGNFIFKGTQFNLDNIKERLYTNTVYSTDIENLGWQYQGFWAWADGITNTDGKFEKADENGLIKFDGKNYLIKPFSKLYADDNSAFINEKKFRRKTSEITFVEWYNQYEKVFGDNAMISACAYFTAVFSDAIFRIVHNELPLINYFGPKGAGKTQQADSLLAFFGEKQPTNNITKVTIYGLSQTLKSFHNAFVLVDEYKNSLDMKWIEFLKSVYNRQGKIQGNLAKEGTKTEHIPINSMVLLCGQDLPTLDVALLDRCICLTASKTEFTDEEVSEYKKLKEMESQGMAHVTDEILVYRNLIIEKFADENAAIQKQISEISSGVSGRLQKSLASILTPAYILKKHSSFELPINLNRALKFGCSIIAQQQKFIESSDDLKNFWSCFQSLLEQNRISEGRNYRLQEKIEVKFVGMTDPISYSRGKWILFLRWEGLYMLYAEYSRRSGIVALGERTLLFYLEKSKYFLGRVASKKFVNTVTKESSVNQAYCFDYEKMNITLKESIPDYEPDTTADIDPLPEATETKLPF